MDARKYASKYIKPDNVRDGPIQTRIVNVFGGPDTNEWIAKELALELGAYKDWRADPPVEKETVRVRAISPGKTAETQNGSLKDDLSDKIPF